VRAIVVASGEAPGDQDWTSWVRDQDLIVGADGGAARVLARGLTPDVVIGDMDSLDGRELDILAGRQVRLIQHPRAKDEADLELALSYAAGQGADEIVVLGGHTDSWDVGQGAMDDAGGVVASWEAVRLLQEFLDANPDTADRASVEEMIGDMNR